MAGQIPALPPSRGYESTGEARLSLRYEDVTQDGRIHLAFLMTGLTAVWRTLADGEKLQSFRDRGILPILSRIVMQDGDAGPFSAHVPVHVEGTWRLTRETDGERLFLDMWLDAYAANGHTLAPPPARDAPRVRVGRVYAEHVITRPFASAGERKVTRLEVPGFPELPEDTRAYEDPTALIAGQPLEAVRDHMFGMLHTDPNQHVNSLVYPRLFEECAVASAVSRERMRAAPGTTPGAHLLLARMIELRYRKPFFSGDRTSIRLALADAKPGITAVGAFFPHGGGAKASTTLAMTLR